tara:strand:+ start:282 stop:734 length:453 start_codon:yes stop_codon:yes gene_type:complete
LRAVRFINHNINPDNTQREISFSVIDSTGLTSNTLTSLISITRAADNVATMVVGQNGVINPDGSGAQATLNMVKGSSYRFNVAQDSFTINNFGFSSTNPTSSITPYTTDVTLSGTQGNAGATLSIKIPRYFSKVNYTSKTSGTDSGELSL